MKKLIVLIVSALLFTGSFNTAFASYTVSNDIKSIDINIAKENLIEDLNFLIETIEDVHPNAYAYIDKDKFYKELQRVKSKINSSMNSMEFYKLVSPLISKLKEGHTNIWMPKNEYYQYLISNNKAIFPFFIEIRDNKLYVKDNLVEDIKIPIGSEILAINNINSSKIITSLLKYETGMKNSYKEVKLQNDFSNLLWLEYGFIDNYEITYKYKNNMITMDVMGIKFDQYNDYVSKHSQNQSNFSYKILDDNICYLNFRSFSDFDSFNVLLDKMFKEIKEKDIQNLIIDIRQNGGGNSILGDLLLSYLYDKPYVMFSQVDAKISKQILKTGLVNVEDENLGKIITFKGNPKIDFNQTDRFKGKVCLLTSRYTFSSAADFASVIKDFPVGVIIGEETGGLASAYGDVYSFQLPHTKINCGVSFKYFVRPNGDRSLHGVIPHKEVKQNLDDSATDKDTVLEYAKKFIVNNYDEVFTSIKKEPMFDSVKVNDNRVSNIKDTLLKFFKHLYNCDYKSAVTLMNKNLSDYYNEEDFVKTSDGFKSSIGNLVSLEISDVKALTKGDKVYEYNLKAEFVGDKASVNLSIIVDSEFKVIQIV